VKIDNPYVYRVFSKVEFENFKNKKFFNGNEFDLKSGFIHLSKKEQLKETLSKYFKNEKDLVIAEFKTENLIDYLRWEVSRNNKVFPHFYNNLEFTWLNKIYKKADI
tara:strand:- start:743 stop:1063 length:321 start_codon:yes stop_codon:yes gene_type:complete